jgi:tRNA dimethylallyltransferase
MARDLLYARIDARVEAMMAAGFVDELARLRAAGYGRRLPAMSALGYRQLWSYFAGEATLEEAVARIKFETHRFVRKQNNWFAPDDPAIQWFDASASDHPAAALAAVGRWFPAP